MEENPESPQIEEQKGQRMLAAIVFTDIVGFSSKTRRDEDRTINAVRRDLGIMSAACKRNGGQVLKNTGDGLLMCFSSAVQALTCAIEAQNDLDALNRSLPVDERLQHRIGVHLGDVILTEDDVYGDGVNVASRLQNEAKPDTILFSRTVYDVVKGKMAFDATYLGPRTLKNIAEPVMIWQIASSTHESNQKEAMAKAAELLREPAPVDSGIAGRRAGFYVLAAVLALGIPIVLFLTMFRGATKQPDTHAGPTLMDKLRQRANGNKESSSTQTQGGTTGKSVAGASTNSEVAPTGPDLTQDPDFITARADFVKKYDFAGLVSWMQTKGYATKPGGPELITRYVGLSEFMKWFAAQVAAATKENPIVGDNDPTTPGQYKVWAGPQGSISYETASGSGQQAINTIPPRTLLAIAKEASVKSAGSSGAPSDETIGIWLTDFQEEFSR